MMGVMNQAFPMHIFRAYDIRGKVSVLNPSVITSIAHALAQQYLAAGQTRMAIGYDARLSSPDYAQAIHAVFQSYALDARIIGCCSSPMLYFIAKAFDGNGVMVTASHNPKDDNGIKWIIQDLPPCPQMIQQVGLNAIQYSPTTFIQNRDSHQYHNDYIALYEQALCDDIQLKQSFHVVIDGLHGSAGYIAARILKKLGCTVDELRCSPNGEFPDHAPDPSVDAHLQLLSRTVVEKQADLGIALDGDGDRLVMVDGQGRIIRADQLLCLFAEMCLSDQPHHEFVFDVKCSTLVRNTVRHLGGTPVMIRTGSSFLRTYLSQSNHHAIFGGEYAGHYVFNDQRGGGYDDGLYAALRIMEYLSSIEKKLEQVLSAYPNRFGTEDLYISTHHALPTELLAWVKSQSQHLNAQISEIDGIRLDFDDGFGIIRASNTGEYFTLRFDADSAERLNEIRHVFVSMLQDQYPLIARDILDAQ